ncbi:hypothetical protein H4V95_003088 [Arthrobacter sp. CAN_C5]|nr:hypothetical protein [Arthrobacter sp. CAN_C5]
MTAWIPRERRRFRLALEEYALSPNARSGLVRALPLPIRGTCNASSKSGNIGESPPWPGPMSITNGRIFPSQR